MIEIQRGAPATGSAEAFIGAPIELVWSVQSDIEGWPDWNPDVSRAEMRGALAPGTQFRWKAGGAPIVSVLRQVDRPRRLVWTGRSLGIRAVHVWSFEPVEGGVRVHTEESFDGLVVRLFRGAMRRMLESSLRNGVAALKSECERRAG